MKKQDLLELSNYEVHRSYIGTYGSKKKYIYYLKTRNGDIFKIRKYDLQDFIDRGAKYIEKN